MFRSDSAESPHSHLDVVVLIEYGKCPGHPPLIGKGRIDEEMTYKGATYVRVQPIEGMRLPKWVNVNEIVAYDFTENVKAVPATVMNADVAIESVSVEAPVKPSLNRSAIISNFGNEIVIRRGDKARSYDNFGRLATPGERRLYDYLRENAHLFTVEPFTFTSEYGTHTSMYSKVWTSKGAK
jgi:hypothetical protein